MCYRYVRFNSLARCKCKCVADDRPEALNCLENVQSSQTINTAVENM